MPARIYGPYARQVLDDGQRLKFWFGRFDRDRWHRFELMFVAGERGGRTRNRPLEKKDAPFRALALPPDMSACAACDFPRHPGDTLAAAARSLLTGRDVADAVRLGQFGIALDIVQNARHVHP